MSNAAHLIAHAPKWNWKLDLNGCLPVNDYKWERYYAKNTNAK